MAQLLCQNFGSKESWEHSGKAARSQLLWRGAQAGARPSLQQPDQPEHGSTDSELTQPRELCLRAGIWGEAGWGAWQPSRTRNAAPKGDSHCAEAVVGHGRDLPGAARPVVVPVLLIRVRHRVRVVGVQVIAAFWALGTDPQSGLGLCSPQFGKSRS